MGKHKSRRDFPGKRWLINLLRAVHLVGVAGVGAGVLAGWPFPQWQGYATALMASGLGILALDVWSNPRYLTHVIGLAVLAKLAFVGWFVAPTGLREWIFWTILVFSVLLSHAPGDLRHRVVIFRPRIPRSPDHGRT